MRVPSNRMHRFPVKNNDTGYPLIAFGLAVAFVVWFGYTLWSDPGLILFLTSTFGLLFIIGTFLVRRRDRRIASLRPNESMCTFARSFDCRTTDTWIIRAVYEKFQPFVGFPLRASDSVDDDLCVDPLEFDLIPSPSREHHRQTCRYARCCPERSRVLRGDSSNACGGG